MTPQNIIKFSEKIFLFCFFSLKCQLIFFFTGPLLNDYNCINCEPLLSVTAATECSWSRDTKSLTFHTQTLVAFCVFVRFGNRNVVEVGPADSGAAAPATLICRHGNWMLYRGSRACGEGRHCK